MTVETFQELANKILAEHVKGRAKPYGWTAWWPEHTVDIQTVVFDYRATLWEDEENYLVNTMLMDKTLTEEQASAHIANWLKSNLPVDN